MPGRVCLAVVAGPIQGRQFAFEDHDTFLFGRSPDCHAQLAEDDGTASRHHFLLEVNPPAARLRDLGSMNGTYVNGTKYGGRGSMTLEKARQQRWPEVDLRDGDGIRVGTTVLRGPRRGDGAGQRSAATTAGRHARAHGPASHGRRLRGSAPCSAAAGWDPCTRPRAGRTGAVVALKLMRPEVVVDTKSRETFAREIEVTASLRHPNVVALYEHGWRATPSTSRLEYCPGGSLAHVLLSARTRWRWSPAVRVILEALEGPGVRSRAGLRPPRHQAGEHPLLDGRMRRRSWPISAWPRASSWRASPG
jgi:serine/threonine protein kinase